MKERRCWYCGKKRPSRRPSDWWTFMCWHGPHGKKKLYVIYGCGEHHDGMREAWEAWVWDGAPLRYEKLGLRP